MNKINLFCENSSFSVIFAVIFRNYIREYSDFDTNLSGRFNYNFFLGLFFFSLGNFDSDMSVTSRKDWEERVRRITKVVWGYSRKMNFIDLLREMDREGVSVYGSEKAVRDRYIRLRIRNKFGPQAVWWNPDYDERKAGEPFKFVHKPLTTKSNELVDIDTVSSKVSTLEISNSLSVKCRSFGDLIKNSDSLVLPDSARGNVPILNLYPTNPCGSLDSVETTSIRNRENVFESDENISSQLLQVSGALKMNLIDFHEANYHIPIFSSMTFMRPSEIPTVTQSRVANVSVTYCLNSCLVNSFEVTSFLGEVIESRNGDFSNVVDQPQSSEVLACFPQTEPIGRIPIGIISETTSPNKIDTPEQEMNMKFPLSNIQGSIPDNCWNCEVADHRCRDCKYPKNKSRHRYRHANVTAQKCALRCVQLKEVTLNLTPNEEIVKSLKPLVTSIVDAIVVGEDVLSQDVENQSVVSNKLKDAAEFYFDTYPTDAEDEPELSSKSSAIPFDCIKMSIV